MEESESSEEKKGITHREASGEPVSVSMSVTLTPQITPFSFIVINENVCSNDLVRGRNLLSWISSPLPSSDFWRPEP